MHANISNFLMGNCMSKYRGERLSHEPETHENRSEARMMQCYRSRPFFKRWRFWVTRTNCFRYLFFFLNCVLGGLMHKLIWPRELFSSLLDKYRWMCSNSDSRYSCPFIATAVVGSAAWLMGSLKLFRNEKRCCSLLDLMSNLVWSSWRDGEGLATGKGWPRCKSPRGWRGGWAMAAPPRPSVGTVYTV